MKFEIGEVEIGDDAALAVILGPCALENMNHSLMLAGEIHKICQELKLPFIFKGSFDKANRTSLNSSRGVGMDEGLEILAAVRETYQCPVLTDIHSAEQCEKVAEIVDVLQIPAFLSRQTDILIAAGQTMRAINVKKGQFMAPHDMEYVIEKIEKTGNQRIMLCERGVSFGYHQLISDFRALPIMAKTGYPVVFDATHSVQQPSGHYGVSGGGREFVPALARAAVAVGCNAVFMEVHNNPEQAISDRESMLKLADLKPLLKSLIAIRSIL